MREREEGRTRRSRMARIAVVSSSQRVIYYPTSGSMQMQMQAPACEAVQFEEPAALSKQQRLPVSG